MIQPLTEEVEGRRLIKKFLYKTSFHKYQHPIFTIYIYFARTSKRNAKIRDIIRRLAISRDDLQRFETNLHRIGNEIPIALKRLCNDLRTGWTTSND